MSHRQGAIGSETEKERIDTTFDNSGFPLQQVDTRGGTVATTNYVHDELGRLASEARTGAAAGNFNNVYNYDKAGNRSSVVRGGVTYPYTKTTNDRLLTGEGYSITSYDNDGNPLAMTVPSVGAQTMVYDDESRLVSLSRPTGTVTYRYDGDGRRVERVGPSGTVRYLYDGATEIATLNSANSILRYRLPGVGDVDGGVQGYDQEDTLGSVLATRNGSGNDVSRQSTDAYGIETTLMAGPRSDHRWAGRHGYVRDDEAGMVMMGARYYVPQLGRFLTQDPIGQEGGLNLYAYCGNSPLARIDPDGKERRSLTGAERTNLGAALQFLTNSGPDGAAAAFAYRVLLNSNPNRIMIDTEIGGAVWKFDTLYIDKVILSDWTNWQAASGRMRTARMGSNFEEKAWASSILFHEAIHLYNNETYMVMRWSQNNAERRAWDGQIQWLQRLQKHYTQDPRRSGSISDLIGRARDVRKDYD
ncbi:hypothetical protein BH11ARM2_BH11ARM2_29600 [soil metagenome]